MPEYWDEMDLKGKAMYVLLCSFCIGLGIGLVAGIFTIRSGLEYYMTAYYDCMNTTFLQKTAGAGGDSFIFNISKGVDQNNQSVRGIS